MTPVIPLFKRPLRVAFGGGFFFVVRKRKGRLSKMAILGWREDHILPYGVGDRFTQMVWYGLRRVERFI